MPIKIILAGATGNLGQHLLTTLTSSQNFTVSILTRQSSTPPNFPPNIPIYTIPGTSYTPSMLPALIEILSGQEILISALGSTAIPQQKVLIDAAIEAGVRHFVPSEFGLDTRNTNAAEILPGFICKEKRDVIEYLEEMRRDGMRMDWTAFVVGVFVEMSIPSYLGFNILKRQATLIQNQISHWSTTTLQTAAQAVKNALLLPPDQISNRYLFIESLNVSQGDLLSSFEEITAAKWDVQYIDAEEENRVALEKLEKGDYSGLPGLMRYVVCTPGHGTDYMEYEESANKLLGLPEERLVDILSELVTKSATVS